MFYFSLEVKKNKVLKQAIGLLIRLLHIACMSATFVGKSLRVKLNGYIKTSMPRHLYCTGRRDRLHVDCNFI